VQCESDLAGVLQSG